MCRLISIFTLSTCQLVPYTELQLILCFVLAVILKLLDFDEEYVFGLPSAYARSILTTPWADI